MVRVSEPPFEVPKEYDEWPVGQRHNYLEKLLDEESVTNWGGTDLRDLNSENVERWLGMSGIEVPNAKNWTISPATHRRKIPLSGKFDLGI